MVGRNGGYCVRSFPKSAQHSSLTYHSGLRWRPGLELVVPKSPEERLGISARQTGTTSTHHPSHAPSLSPYPGPDSCKPEATCSYVLHSTAKIQTQANSLNSTSPPFPSVFPPFQLPYSSITHTFTVPLTHHFHYGAARPSHLIPPHAQSPFTRSIPGETAIDTRPALSDHILLHSCAYLLATAALPSPRPLIGVPLHETFSISPTANQF